MNHSSSNFAGKDYNPVSKLLEFGVNVTKLEVEVQILYDENSEMREQFSLHIRYSQLYSNLFNLRHNDDTMW